MKRRCWLCDWTCRLLPHPEKSAQRLAWHIARTHTGGPR